MSDGHYCIMRDLGLVKGGKGMKHHEVVIDFNRRGMLQLFERAFAKLSKPRHQASDVERIDLPGRPVGQIAQAVRSLR